MSDQLTAAEDRLIESLAESPRGVRRNGAYALWLFVRLHRSLRVTPAMAAGVSNRLWSIEELVERAT